MSALDAEHMEGTEVNHSPRPRSIARHHPCSHQSPEHTLGLVNTDEVFLVRMVVICGHQVLMILLGPSRWTCHSVQASSAMNHVI